MLNVTSSHEERNGRNAEGTGSNLYYKLKASYYVLCECSV